MGILVQQAETFDPKNVLHEIVLVTPEMAKEWLKRNIERNRRLNKKRLDQMISDLKNKDWSFDADPIRFDEDDVLIDGQHRLNAVVKAGIPTHFLVVTGLKRESFKTIDSGKSRSHGDRYQTCGEQNVNLLAGAVNIAATYRHSDKTRKGISFQEQERLLAKHPGIRDFVNLVSNNKQLRQLGQASALSFLLYAFKLSDEKTALKFIAELKGEQPIAKGDPAFTLKDRLVREKQKKGENLTAVEASWLIVNAWHYRLRGGKVTSLTVKAGKPIPEIKNVDRKLFSY